MAYSLMLNRFAARLLAGLVTIIFQPSPHSQASSTPTTVNLNPSADTSLFELSPDSNMGSMSHIASGTIRTGQKSRALYSFNLSSIPSNATITSASLSIPVVIVPPGAPPATFGLHRMLQSWTEGNKSGNRGSTASTGEPTWNSRAKGSTSWGAPGGSAGSDFSASPAASVSVNGLGTYTFNSTDSLVADAQAWLANPSSNFGWMLLCQSEGVTKSARRFAARENAAPPILRITYTTPATQTQPQIQWSAPASITHGTQLSSAQLNATANTPGSFVYSPTAGTQLDAGTHTLSVTFTPTDTVNFSSAAASVALEIQPAALTVTIANQTRFKDETNPTLTGIITGIAAGDDIRAVYTTSATPLSPPGTYPITAQWADPQNRLSNYHVTIQEGTLLILDSVTTLKGIGFDGYIADATVFLDLNNNQTLDTNEPSAITDLKGKFSLPVSATRVDANRNGRIDGTEGSLVLVGGIDQSTGLPLTTPLMAPANSGVISPVTTLLTAFLKAKPETTETPLRTWSALRSESTPPWVSSTTIRSLPLRRTTPKRSLSSKQTRRCKPSS